MHTREVQGARLKVFLRFANPNREKPRKPWVNLLQAAFALRPVPSNIFRFTSHILTATTQSPKNRVRGRVARLLALTPSPEQFERRTGVHRISGVEADVVNTGFTGWGTGNPSIATAKDVGCRATSNLGGDNGPARLAAGIAGCGLTGVEDGAFGEIVGITGKRSRDESEQQEV